MMGKSVDDGKIWRTLNMLYLTVATTLLGRGPTRIYVNTIVIRIVKDETWHMQGGHALRGSLKKKEEGNEGDRKKGVWVGIGGDQ